MAISPEQSLKGLENFEGLTTYGIGSSAELFQLIQKDCAEAGKDAVDSREQGGPTIGIFAGESLSGKTRLMLLINQLLQGVRKEPPILWADSITTAKKKDLIPKDRQFGELRGYDFEASTRIFEGGLHSLIRRNQLEKGVFISVETPLFTAGILNDNSSKDSFLEFIYETIYDSEKGIPSRGVLVGNNRAFTTIRQLMLHQPPFNKSKYRAFLICAIAVPEVRAQGLKQRLDIHKAKTTKEMATVLHSGGYDPSDIEKLLENPVRLGGPLKAIQAVGRDMNAAVLALVTNRLVVPPSSYFSPERGVMVKLPEGDRPFTLNLLEQNLHYRTRVFRETFLPYTAKAFIRAPEDRTFIGLQTHYDLDTHLDTSPLEYSENYLSELWAVKEE